ncbi:MAG: iron-sulfur cluster-binding domain-containing protein [Vicinamibacterales bacterium]
MSLVEPSVPVSLVGLVTTVHLAMVALRAYRRPGSARSSLTAISALFLGCPWLWPSAVGLGLGLAAHALWFLACERLVSPSGAAASDRTSSVVPAVDAPATPAARRPTVATRASGAAVRAASAERPRGFVQLPVLAAFDETPEIRTFRLARPDGFDFVPGQFLTVRFRADGREHARCYSISSAPEARGYLELSVKRLGVVSNALHAALRPGALLSVRPPAGAFTYPSGEDRPIVLLAGGVGMTPLMSMLRHGVMTEPSRPITLLYSAGREEGLAYRDEIRALRRRHPQLRVYFAVSRGAPSPEFYPGRIDETLIRAAAPDIAHSISLICGPPAMIDAMKDLLVGLDVPERQVKAEYFEAAVAASRRLRSARDAGATLAAQPTVGTAPEITFERSGVCIRAELGQTLLEAARANGVDIPSLCRAGVCGTCRTRVQEGDVDCGSDLLDEDERRTGVVLACVTAVRSNCVVEA